MTAASIVIPTRARLRYLRVALASICDEAATLEAEVLVVDDDGPSPEAQALVDGFGARYEPHEAPLGLNAARNTGVARSSGALVVFVDDDVAARPGWLGAMLAAAAADAEVACFAGRIVAALEGPAPRSCGRESPPITTLDLGGRDSETAFAWGANMAIRRSALERVGPFDTSLADGGDEQEWQERMRRAQPPGRVLYVAAAEVAHRREGEDAGLAALMDGARSRGRAARRFDARRGRAPSPRAELGTLIRCVGHVLARRCPAGLTMVAHSSGRLGEAVRERRGASAAGEDFLSGASGTVGGLGGAARNLGDGAYQAWELASGRRSRLHLAARRDPPRRRVLVLGVERPERAALARAAVEELGRSRHEVHVETRPPGGKGKFENLNGLLEEHPAAEHDWLLVIDDDVVLPRGFLDDFIFLCERFDLALAQPAHRLDSHAAWSVTRRRPRSVARETGFVEIGPVTAFASVTFPTLLPFPPVRMGWGLDVHWAAVARTSGWRIGVIDAVSIRHRAAPAAEAYDRDGAIAEARAFLADRPYVRAAEADRTLATHRRW